MNVIAKIKGYFKSVKVEMQKVTWPTKEEIKGSTAIVIITLAIVGAYVGVIDLVLSYVIGLLIR